MKNLVQISLFSILICNSCISLDDPCITEIKHFERHKSRIGIGDSYYVYDFKNSEGCYAKLLSFAKAIQLDSSQDHYIQFFRSSKYLPDTSSLDKYELSNSKYNEYLILTYTFDFKNNRKQINFYDKEEIIKIINVNQKLN